MTTSHTLEEHERLAKAWLEAEQTRIKVLQQLLKELGGKCTADYPEKPMQAYQDALNKAAAANRNYAQWLAAQGIPYR